jgi:hypothetical protein
MNGIERTTALALLLLLASCSSTSSGSAGGVAVDSAEGETPLAPDENAYNPIPSPDGARIACTRARWGRRFEGDSSRLDSEVIVLDAEGRLLTPRALADTFTGGWTADGQNLVCFRDGAGFLVGLDGQRSPAVPLLRNANGGVPERTAYLASERQLVLTHTAENEVQLVLGDGRVVARHKLAGPALGDMIVPSPDERYLAVLDASFMTPDLRIFDRKTGLWSHLGAIVVYPQSVAGHWDALKPRWNPWFADGSRLVFATANGIVTATPDGKTRDVLVPSNEKLGLPVPSPDGQWVAYLTLEIVPRRETPTSNNFENTQLWVVRTEPGAQPRALTRKTAEATFSIGWLNPREVVFDRISWSTDDPRRGPATPKAAIWKIGVPGG